MKKYNSNNNNILILFMSNKYQDTFMERNVVNNLLNKESVETIDLVHNSAKAIKRTIYELNIKFDEIESNIKCTEIELNIGILSIVMKYNSNTLNTRTNELFELKRLMKKSNWLTIEFDIMKAIDFNIYQYTDE